MARLADDYKNFTKRNVMKLAGDSIEIWRITKPKSQRLIYRLQDAWYVITGKYDAVYYHEDIVETKRN